MRELLSAGSPVSGRQLRRELKLRFGAAGKTARVFQIWRDEARPAAALPVPQRDSSESLRLRVQAAEGRAQQAEAKAAEQLARAERAELREQAHQDRWAGEIDRLRQALNAQPKYAAEIRALREQITRLTLALHGGRDVPAP